MLHLLKYNLLVKVKCVNVIFWPLVFPLILATFFYFAFGNIEEADFETVQTIVVKEADADAVFLEFLETMEEDESHLVEIQEMSEQEALSALKEKKASGIYFVGATPTLTVGSSGISESILQSLLESYENGKQTLQLVAEKHPDGLSRAIEQMGTYEALVEQVSLGGKTTDGYAQFFYALIAMACLYGEFIGMDASLNIQANLTPLAARRSVTPTHKLKLILMEMISCFLLHYVNVLILIAYLRYVLKVDFEGQMSQMLLISLIGSMIGVSMGIFIGSFGKLGEGMKVGILLGISMTGSFLAGLMSSSMKYLVDRHVPFVNRINPAAVISDAFYCINVYDDPVRFRRNLVTLSCMCVILTLVSFLLIRRERYDSI